MKPCKDFTPFIKRLFKIRNFPWIDSRISVTVGRAFPFFIRMDMKPMLATILSVSMQIKTSKTKQR